MQAGKMKNEPVRNIKHRGEDIYADFASHLAHCPRRKMACVHRHVHVAAAQNLEAHSEIT